MLKEAKLFKNGQSQALRLPKEFRFKGKSVLVNKVGDCLIIIPKDKPWNIMIDACSRFSDDFMLERVQGEFEDREQID